MKKLTIIILLIIGVASSYYIYNFTPALKGIDELKESLFDEIGDRVLAPPPLRAVKLPFYSLSGVLTEDGIFKATNIHREKDGLSALALNADLGLAAKAKVDDMFAKQYFEHVSPLGTDASDLVKENGYEYLIVGENLALGNYKDDASIVQAWMDSPGHRANILNSSFKEIGVAVKKEKYEGKNTWMGVQIFAAHISDCPYPDDSIKTSIKINKVKLDELESGISILKIDIENHRPKRGQEFEDKVDRYNALVTEYNDLVKNLGEMITDYNLEVRIFNDCLGG